MKAKSTITGYQQVIKNLGTHALKYGPSCRLVVGYSAPYALHVHEDLETFHRVGQAKFLEEPIRTWGKSLAQFVTAKVKAGWTLMKAVYEAGLILQRESQLLVPVDTGFLKSSAYTKVIEVGQ